jgi:transposase
MNAQLALALPWGASSNTVVINTRCTLRVEEEQRVIVVGGLPVHHYRSDDAVAEAYAMVLLVDSGFAQQTDVARAFEKSERTVRRYQERYAQSGMVGLGREVGWPRGRRRISGKRLRSIEILKSQGLSNRAIAQRLGVNEKAIRKLVGPSKGAEVEQLSFATSPTNAPASAPLQAQASSTESIEKSADEELADHPRMPSADDAAHDWAVIDEHAEDSEPVPMSLDRDASDRTFDRQLAYLGLLDDAAPIFRDGSQVPGVGVLLALPCLIESGLLCICRKLYGGIGPAFYGLRTTLLTLSLMALLRIQRPAHR